MRRHLALAPVLLAAVCCHPAAAPPAVPAAGQAVAVEPLEQMRRAVRIEVDCKIDGDLVTFKGSGVVVGDDRVLTAYHVVDCVMRVGTQQHAGHLLAVRVMRGDIERSASVEVAMLPADVARLKTRGLIGATWWSAQQLGPVPRAGDEVCMSSLYPKVERKCGMFEEQDNDESGDMAHGAVTRPGNSGSGLYDAHGRLVGIVTHFRAFGTIQFGGRATALSRFPWMLAVPQ